MSAKADNRTSKALHFQCRTLTQEVSAGIVLMLAGILLNGGASHKAPPNSTPSPTDMAAHNPVTNNPPDGKPNHLSPEMQAQINHYKSVS